MKCLKKDKGSRWRLDANNGISSCVFRHPARRRGFTLMEVMIACGILFMCLFGILALVSSSLRNARALQQHKAIDAGTIAGVIYVALSNTNQVNEGDIPVNLNELLPGYKCLATVTEIRTNGLSQIDFEVERNNQLELQSHFFMYLPQFKQGMSTTLH